MTLYSKQKHETCEFYNNKKKWTINFFLLERNPNGKYSIDGDGNNECEMLKLKSEWHKTIKKQTHINGNGQTNE